MKLITTQKPPLNLFEVTRVEVPFPSGSTDHEDDWTTILEVPAYKINKTAIEPNDRLIEIACIMTGVLVTNPGTVANDDSDIEVSARFDVQQDFDEYGSLPIDGTWAVGDVIRVGRSLYVCADISPLTFEKFLDELAAPNSTYYIDASEVNPPSFDNTTLQDAIDDGVAAVDNKETFVVTVNNVSNNIVYVKHLLSNNSPVAIPLRKRYALVSNFVISPSDFALISLERQVMKSGDMLQLRCENNGVTAIAHFSYILNQREEYTKEF